MRLGVNDPMNCFVEIAGEPFVVGVEERSALQAMCLGVYSHCRTTRRISEGYSP